MWCRETWPTLCKFWYLSVTTLSLQCKLCIDVIAVEHRFASPWTTAWHCVSTCPAHDVMLSAHGEMNLEKNKEWTVVSVTGTNVNLRLVLRGTAERTKVGRNHNFSNFKPTSCDCCALNGNVTCHKPSLPVALFFIYLCGKQKGLSRVESVGVMNFK